MKDGNKMKLEKGTGIKHKKTGSLACIHEVFPHMGEDTNWEQVTCYHVRIIGKGRYQYINHNDLIKKWDILTENEYSIEFNKIWDGKR